MESETAPGDGLLRLGDYDLQEEIGRGGMAVVYRARQLSLNRIVALKVMLHGHFANQDFLRRFQNEARAVAALRHPNIVTIHEIGEYDGNHFISLELIEGSNFADLTRKRPLPSNQAARYLKLVAEAVEHAHAQGVLHRDLKPSNLLLDVFDQPWVTDFGLAKLADGETNLTTTGQIFGSPSYMPPEQALGKFSDCTAQSDIYSLGAILYELLSGRPPFQGETLQAIITQVQNAEPVPPRRLNPGTPVDLQTICLKCLQKEPARRYASAKQLAEDLGRFLDRKPILARPVSPMERTWLWCRRHQLTASLSVSLFISILAGLVGIFSEWRQAERHAQGETQLRLIAENDAAQTQLNLYAADLTLAAEAYQHGNPGQARRKLQALKPRPGEPDLRGFEWRYLWNLCRGDQVAAFCGHTRTVTCAAFSPDGLSLASGSQDGTVKIWSVSRHELLKDLTISPDAVRSVRFTGDGGQLVTSSKHGVIFWDAHTWLRLRAFPGELCAVSSNGDFLATAESSPFYWETAGPVRLFHWRTGQLLWQLPVPGRAVALSPDGNLLALAGTNHGISVWDISKRTMFRDWNTESPIWSLNFAPDGQALLSSGWTSDVMLWPVNGTLAPKSFRAGDLHVWSAVFSPDGGTIATTSSDQTLRLWNAGSLSLNSVKCGHESEIWCAAFSPDGQWLATGGKDQNVLLWSAMASANPPVEPPHDGDFDFLFSPDGSWLATVNPQSGDAELWRTDGASQKRSFPGRIIIGFSPDAKYVMGFDASAMCLDFWEPDTPDAQKRVALAGAPFGLHQPVHAFTSPDQKYFFAIDDEGGMRLWQAESGALLSAIQGPRPPIRNAVLSPAGRQIAICVERENMVHLYDCQSGQDHRLVGHTDFVSGLAFSPDGKTLATGSMDGTIRLWQTATGQSLATLPGHIQETTAVAFSPDGRTLASVANGESLKLWHLPTLREVFSCATTNAGGQVQFSPDGQRLAMTTKDQRIHLFAAPREP